MAPDVCAYPDEAAVHAAAAQVFAAVAAEAVHARRRFRVCLSGGSTPLGLYRLLAAPPWRGRIPWAAAEVYWGDERAVPPDDPASNARAAREALLSQVPIAEAQVHRLDGEARPLAAAAREYEALLRTDLGERADGTPRDGFDLLLLGMGADGHTASLFPGDEALAETRRWVVPVTAPPGVRPAERLTLTLPALAAARRVLFLVAGADKAAALRTVLTRPGDAPLLPAARVTARGPITWLVTAPLGGV